MCRIESEFRAGTTGKFILLLICLLPILLIAAPARAQFSDPRFINWCKKRYGEVPPESQVLRVYTDDGLVRFYFNKTVPNPDYLAAVRLFNLHLQEKLAKTVDDLISKGSVTPAITLLKQNCTKYPSYAPHKLGKIYLDGKLTKPDYKQASKYLYQSAKVGNNESRFLIGRMFLLGEGSPKDFKSAAEWFELTNTPEANYLAGWIHENKISNSEAIAIRLYEKAVKGDFPPAMSELGEAYLLSHGVSQNNAMARKLFEGANKKNDLKAKYYLAEMSAKGLDTEKNLDAAKQLLADANALLEKKKKENQETDASKIHALNFDELTTLSQKIEKIVAENEQGEGNPEHNRSDANQP